MQLIKGTYSKEDALEIVQQIIRVKIRFHEEKISLSDQEEDIKMRERRIKDLQHDLAAFRKEIAAQEGSVNMNALLNLDGAEPEAQQFSLINGIFDARDAIEILGNAYQSKMNFHTNKAFSLTERGLPGAEKHQRRLAELQAELDRARALLSSDAEAGRSVSMVCTLALSFQPHTNSRVQKPALAHSH